MITASFKPHQGNFFQEMWINIDTYVYLWEPLKHLALNEKLSSNPYFQDSGIYIEENAKRLQEQR